MNAMKVKDVASYPAIGIKNNETIIDAVHKMNKNNIGALIVYDGEEAIGIVTERDIMINFEKDSSSLISDVMSSPIISIDEKVSIGTAAQKLFSKKIRRLGVTNSDGKIVGFINLRDILTAVHESFLAIFDLP